MAERTPDAPPAGPPNAPLARPPGAPPVHVPDTTPARSPDAPIAPSAEGERLDLIDALRGLALAGVLLTNLRSLTLFSFLPSAGRAALPTAGFDRAAEAVMQALVFSKALTLFSLLFGLGFAMQLERARARQSAGLRVFLRRIVVLAVIGAAHAYLLWWGDILLVYALLAVPLIAFRNASGRVLVGGGLVFALVLPAALAPSLNAFASRATVLPRLAAANMQVFGGGTFLEVLRQNAVFRNALWVVLWTLPLFVFGRFLVGYWAGRSRLLADPSAHRTTLRRGLAIGLLVGSACTALEFAQGALAKTVPALASGAGGLVVRAAVEAGTLGLGIAYACGFALLFTRPRWRRWLLTLAPVGRMALSNYLVQSVVGVFVFYGIGAGVGPRFGWAGPMVTWALLFSAQMAASRWWLARFRFGPAEWLWRSLTYGHLQPMRGAAQTAGGES